MQNAGAASLSIPIMLLGLKSDLSDKREVSYEEAMAFAEERNMMYFEVSSKTQ